MDETQKNKPDSFQLGLQAFNRHAFYEAHEHFEDAWRQTSTDEREFFRAFLHLSGGFYRLTQDRPGAARKFFTHAQKWLSLFPGEFRGYDLVMIIHHIQQLIDAIDQNTPTDVILQRQFQSIQPKEGQN